MDVSEIIKFHLQRFSVLQNDRSVWDSQWEDAAARVIPSHKDSFSSRGANQLSSPGQKKTEEMFDATPALACQRFASVIESLSTPQSGRWHRLVPSDKRLRQNRRVREYFDEVTDLLFSYRYRPSANFVGNSQQVYQSLGAYGNGVMFVDQPDDQPGLRYRSVHLSEAYLVQNHAGVVDTMYRPFYLTAMQAVQQFAQCPAEIRSAAATAAETERKFQFLHIVTPREDFVPGALDVRGKRFQSMYLSITPEAPLSEGGYDKFPYVISRYTQTTGEIYGRGPAQWVLPSIKLLNEQKKVVLKQGHRSVDPILLAFDDGTIDGFSMRAGAVNKGGVNADGRALVQTLPVGRIDVGEKLMEMERSVINDAFLISLFQILIDTPQMTATEVLERAREKGMLVAPLAGRIQAEFLGPLIEREIELLVRQQLLPPMPPLLAEASGQYKVEYDSPMSRMQRAEHASGFMRTLSTAAEYSKMTGDPSPLDHFNFDVAMPALMDINGAPVAWTRDPAAVAAIRKGRAEAAQAEQMTAAAPGMAQMLTALPEAAKQKATATP